MNLFRVTVADPADIINTYGNDPLLRAERSDDGVTYVEFADPTIYVDTTIYPIADPTGTPTTWYRTRYSDAIGNTFSAYGDPFQVAGAALDYATLEAVKLRLGLTDTDDDQKLSVVIAEVNDWLEDILGCPVGPSTATALTLDSRDARNEHRMLYLRQGIRSVSALTVAGRPVTSFYLRPLAHDRRPGWPAQYLWLANGHAFPNDWADVVVTGEFGFESIPTTLTEVAEVVAVRAFNAIRTGQADTTGSDGQGQPQVSRYVAGRDRDTIERFRRRLTQHRGMGSVWLSNQ